MDKQKKKGRPRKPVDLNAKPKEKKKHGGNNRIFNPEDYTERRKMSAARAEAMKARARRQAEVEEKVANTEYPAINECLSEYDALSRDIEASIARNDKHLEKEAEQRSIKRGLAVLKCSGEISSRTAANIAEWLEV